MAHPSEPLDRRLGLGLLALVLSAVGLAGMLAEVVHEDLRQIGFHHADAAPDGDVLVQIELAGGAVLAYTVASDKMDAEALSWFVDNDIAKLLLSVRGVGAINRVGGVDREVQVLLDPLKLQALGVSAVRLAAVALPIRVGREAYGRVERRIGAHGGEALGDAGLDELHEEPPSDPLAATGRHDGDGERLHHFRALSHPQRQRHTEQRPVQERDPVGVGEPPPRILQPRRQLRRHSAVIADARMLLRQSLDDGWKYRGRGPQLTGKDNYSAAAKRTGLPLPLLDLPGLDPKQLEQLVVVSQHNAQRHEMQAQFAREVKQLELRQEAAERELSQVARVKRRLADHKATIDAKAMPAPPSEIHQG